jgi:DNA-binding MarR family transcriptional regulator
MMRALEAGAESASAVGENLGLSVSAVTQVANRLESLGLIQRTETLSDRRVKPLALTDRGRELLDLRNQVRVERADTAMRRISLEDQTAILQALTILRDAWISEDPSKAVPVISAEVSQQSTTTSSTEELTSMARRMIETHRPA